jgi:hypothetical protein
MAARIIHFPPAELERTTPVRALTPEQIRLAVEGFFRIAALWGASNIEMRRMLGDPPERTFYLWKSG